jgi:hypothetical protein
MKRALFTIALIGLFCLVGCDESAQDSASGKNGNGTIEQLPEIRVESPDLAKVILKPQREKFDISKDPFRPLFYQGSYSKDGETPVVDEVGGWKWGGVVRIGQESLLLMKNDTGRGFFRVNDKIDSYTIIDIQQEQAVLNDGKKDIILKRSVEN